MCLDMKINKNIIKTYIDETMKIEMCEICYILIMGEVTSTTFNHTTGCVEVYPQEESKVWSFEIVVNPVITQYFQQLFHRKYSLADGLDELVFTLLYYQI